jgi:hypothetical protein
MHDGGCDEHGGDDDAQAGQPVTLSGHASLLDGNRIGGP